VAIVSDVNDVRFFRLLERQNTVAVTRGQGRWLPQAALSVGQQLSCGLCHIYTPAARYRPIKYYTIEAAKL